MLKSAGFRGEVKKKNLTLQPKLSGFLVKLSRFYALVGGLFVKFFMKNLTGPPRRASVAQSGDARRTELATRDAAHGAAARKKRALARNAVEAPGIRSRRQKAVLSADD